MMLLLLLQILQSKPLQECRMKVAQEKPSTEPQRHPFPFQQERKRGRGQRDMPISNPERLLAMKFVLLLEH